MKKSAFASPANIGLLANRYQLKHFIGRGGMGEVFLADDVLLGGIPVAIKFLSQTVSEPKMEQDFAREARICAALSQKTIHIVRVTDYGVNKDGKPFYVMEYLLGNTLKDLIPMSLPMFLALCRQICLGLQCAHNGMEIDGKVYPLVHRDIKPANILVLPDPILGQLVKILDFGIAKFLNYSNSIRTTTKGFHGTLPYCSPEQLEADELDNRSDIYSLGVMMFEMLTGEKPWQPESDFFGAWYKAHHFEKPRNITDIKPNLKLPKELNSLIMGCLAKAPSDRPQNLTAVIKVLDSLEVAGIGDKVKHSPPHAPTSSSGLTPAVEQACKILEWPKDKPIQEIVFPHLLETGAGIVTALLLMMPKHQINSYAFSTRYNQFIFVRSPHPMLLWVTLLHNKELGPKWLPCYLDMQKVQNYKIVNSLADRERYPLIFFTLEAPYSCASVISCHIETLQRQLLKNWTEQSQCLPPSSAAALSKELLKQQYKLMQPQILHRLTLD
ncbi:serine/threonine protein kinase [Scytonema hofmannii PCC 7110]|uniref:Serine/threonine protein kinase n=1 Tax=Scytonema hofmannii PCC 7110 TaxID=128403 RepID=A0A139WX97_9CYAN|nr:serine/threonine-protein kinase [Scytonema hofmannii]KYC37061.1 serine/threonine protein kinase [Scytonema hofmannii PCC 7110]